MDDIIEIGDDMAFHLDGGGSGGSGSGNMMGINFLMNEKQMNSGIPAFKGDIDLQDLDNLENELNDMSYGSGGISGSGGGGGSSIGQNTVKMDSTTKTWDGYSTINTAAANIDPDRAPAPQMNHEEMMRRKMKRLHELEMLERKGIQLTKKYNMDNSLQEMDAEYNLHLEIKQKQNSVKMMGQTLLTFVNGIEWLNDKFDPFDLRLDGFGESVNENMNDYDSIFEELYEIYKTKVSFRPELKLLFTLGGTAAMVHMQNYYMSNAMPGMDDVMRENPDLMKAFQSAAVNTMSKQAPQSGFGGFMQNIIGGGQQQQMDPRPDISIARGQGGIDMRDNFTNPGFTHPSAASAAPQPIPQRNIHSGMVQQPPPVRQEMSGPRSATNIDDILSNLKTKSVNLGGMNNDGGIRSVNGSGSSAGIDIQVEDINNMDAAREIDLGGSGGFNLNMDDLNASTISISELKDLQSSGGGLPKKSSRKGRGSRSSNVGGGGGTTISLDL